MKKFTLKLYNVSKRVINIDEQYILPLDFIEYENKDELDKAIAKYPAVGEQLADGTLRAYNIYDDTEKIAKIEDIKSAVLYHGATNDTIYADDEFGQYAAILRRYRMRYVDIAKQQKATEQATADRWAMSQELEDGL